MKKFIVFLAVVLAFSLPVCAESDKKSGYEEQYEAFDADEIEKALPDESQKYLDGINPENPDWINNLTPQNVFSHIFEFFKSGAEIPLSCGGVIFGIILISAAFPAMASEGKADKTAHFAATLSLAVIVSEPVWNLIRAAVSAIKGCSAFMFSFVPVFASIVAVSGGAVTSVSMSALLLGAAEFTSWFASFAILPVMGAYLAMSITSGVSLLVSNANIAEGIKKAAFWVLSLICTVFVGILSIQTAVNSSADSLALKTTKFIMGSTVPIAGAALAEAVSTVSSSLGLLRSSVGIYSVVALAVILLPILAELIIFRLVLIINISVADIFSESTISKTLKAVDSMLSLLVSVILIVGAMFIIALTVTVGAVKNI